MQRVMTGNAAQLFPDGLLPIFWNGRERFGGGGVDRAVSIGRLNRLGQSCQLHALADVSVGDTELGCDRRGAFAFLAVQPGERDGWRQPHPTL